jgi:hypothetical protein
VPEHRGGIEEPLDRLAHAANDTGRMAAGTIRPARRRADRDRPTTGRRTRPDAASRRSQQTKPEDEKGANR